MSQRDHYSIVLAETGEEAMEYLKNDLFKLVLLDIMLPGIDGFSVCAAIRETQDIPIISKN